MAFGDDKKLILRQSVVGMEGMWAKMFDPPKASPATPDMVPPTNPVPEVMAAAGMLGSGPSTPHTVSPDLMHGHQQPTWDGQKNLLFFLIRDGDNPAAVGTFPGPTYRIPRGVVFHANTQGHGPPPHTIHWHGLEPTPMNDGVGHCSMEIGDYTYQWQPNFIGSYFYHCHRNTVQHFEFGLYGFIVIEAPDAYFSTLLGPAVLGREIPIGAGRDGLRRTAANLGPTPYNQIGFPQFPDFEGGKITDPDPWNGDTRLKFATNPHAMTVAYDVEALWVFAARDSVWSDMAPNARATYPKHGNVPGVDDQFQENPGQDGFFAFNDYHADYWYVTGVPVPAHKGDVEPGILPTGVVIPAELNSGIAGTQVSIDAKVNETILLRQLNGSYNCTEVTFPVDVVCIAWDGRALGVPPYGDYNHPYLIKAGTPIHQSVARRCDLLIRSSVEVNDFATVKFINTRGQLPDAPEEVLVTAKIPFHIGPPLVAGGTHGISGSVMNADVPPAPMVGATVTIAPISLGGSKRRTVTLEADGTFVLPNLTDGMYEIRPHMASNTRVHFEPDVLTVSLNGADIPGVEFVQTLNPPRFVVEGDVLDEFGEPLKGVTMHARPVYAVEGEEIIPDVVTNASGHYRFEGLFNLDYIITPEKTGRTFAPPHLHVIIHAADLANVDFAQQAKPKEGVRFVEGVIKDDKGAPIAGVLVHLTGTKVMDVVTDGAGRYRFDNLPDGTYFVTPEKAGRIFAPAAVEAMVMGADKPGVNFATAPQQQTAETVITLSTKTNPSLDYGKKFVVAGTLMSGGTGLAGQQVILQSAAPRAAFKDVAQVTTGAGGTFSFSVKPATKTNYRARFAGFGTTGFKNSVSTWIGATPEAYVRTPIARSSMSVTKEYTVYGYLKPKVKAGTFPVRIYKEKKTASGKWKKQGFVKAKASNYSSYTKYSAKMKLGSKGEWRLRAYAPAGNGHAATWSSGWDKVTVK